MTLNPADFKVDTYRQAGRDGWIRGPDVGVRVLHIPTGVSAEAEEYRSSHANKQLAFDRLITKLKALPKPRIYWLYKPKWRRGYWRVSKMPKPYHRNQAAWNYAHALAYEMNFPNCRKESQK